VSIGGGCRSAALAACGRAHDKSAAMQQRGSKDIDFPLDGVAPVPGRRPILAPGTRVHAVTVRRRTVYARRVETDNPADIPEKIAALRTEHRDLDEAIARLVDDADADEVAIKRLKKRKLWLKDCIARLESALIPDEPA
jgi:hypothetical protein